MSRMSSSSLSVFDVVYIYIYIYEDQTVTMHLVELSALIRAISGTRGRDKEEKNQRSSWL